MARYVHSSPNLLCHDPGPLKLNYTLNSSTSHGRTLAGRSNTSIPHLPHMWTLDLLKFFVQWASFLTVSAGTGHSSIFPIHLDNEIQPKLCNSSSLHTHCNIANVMAQRKKSESLSFKACSKGNLWGCLIQQEKWDTQVNIQSDIIF